MSRETRAFTLDGAELRERGGKLTFHGHAAIFDALSEPFGGMWRERVASGAFRKTIKDGADVRFLINHDPNLVLARTKSSTLTLTEDRAGLQVAADMAPTSYARDMAVLLGRGDVDQMSFGFEIAKQEWDEEHRVRTLREVKLFDVSVVTFPAYPQTDAELRFRVATGFSDLELHKPNAAWNPEAARVRVARWASSDGSGDRDKIDWARYRDAFLWYDKTNDESFRAYKLPIADVVDGALRVVPAGVKVAAAEASRSRVPAGDLTEVQAHVERYYSKMRDEFNDETLIPPWRRNHAIRDVAGLNPDEWGVVFAELREGKVLSSKNLELVRNAHEALGALLSSATPEAASLERQRRHLRLLEKQLAT